jgi:hypothetical protein
MISDKQRQYLYDLATSFVDVNHRLVNELRDKAEDIVVRKELPWDDFSFVWEILREGAIMYKHRELVHAYEEAKEEADNGNDCYSV